MSNESKETKQENTKMNEETKAVKPEITGAFIESLKRNNKQIRDDRAMSIVEDSELRYRRAIEDIKVDIRKMKRDQENMLDLSPESAISLKLASDFDAGAYVVKDLELSRKIFNAEVQLELAEKRFAYLFGGK